MKGHNRLMTNEQQRECDNFNETTILYTFYEYVCMHSVPVHMHVCGFQGKAELLSSPSGRRGRGKSS